MKTAYLPLFFILWITTTFSQSNELDSPQPPVIDTALHYLGGEIKGMYVAGGFAGLTGVAAGILIELTTDGGRKGIGTPLVAGGLAIAPASLIGLGIGSLLGRHHSHFTHSFQVGLGMTLSPTFMRSPPFPENKQPEGRYVSGINIRLLSPQIGKWRYNLGLNHFFSRTYEFLDGAQQKSWQSINLDLQYTIRITDEFQVYPLVGSQYHNFLKSELYTNVGTGLNVGFAKQWRLYGEVKWSLDPDERFNQANYSFGVLFCPQRKMNDTH